MNDHPGSRWRLLLDPLLVIAALAAVAVTMHIRKPARTVPRPGIAFSAPRPIPPAERPAQPEREPEPQKPARPIAPPEPDRQAVARAEAALEAARRDREVAETRVRTARDRLQQAELEAASAVLAAKSLAERVRDPSARLVAVRQRGAALKQEHQALQAELVSLANAPRPRRKSLIDKSPVARPPEGEEYHFEIRKDRVAYIDLERLIDRVKADAMLQIRLANGPMTRPLSSSVGPVGDFAMRYELGRDMPLTLEEAVQARGGSSYSLRGWEVVPVRELRGETIEAIGHPASQFSRILNTLNPRRDTITMWVYPDGFSLYRKLRDLLHARGFVVAARPLPSGMAIRGSPAGSLSAGQ